MTDYQNVLTELLAIATEWRDLALVLGVLLRDIKTISENHPRDVRRCVELVVDRWFQSQPTPLSWNTLCSALRHPLVSRSDVAQAIEQNYCQN